MSLLQNAKRDCKISAVLPTGKLHTLSAERGLSGCSPSNIKSLCSQLMIWSESCQHPRARAWCTGTVTTYRNPINEQEPATYQGFAWGVKRQVPFRTRLNNLETVHRGSRLLKPKFFRLMKHQNPHMYLRRQLSINVSDKRRP